MSAPGVRDMAVPWGSVAPPRAQLQTLLLDSPPRDIHAVKSAAPAGRGIFGEAVFVTDAVRALLTYGSYDCYCFRCGLIADSDASGGWGKVSGRVRVLDSENLHELATYDQPVLASGGPYLLDHQLVRRMFSPTCEWPITGVVQAVESKWPPDWLLQVVLGHSRPWDALICPSLAVRRVIENHLDALADSYPALAPLLPAGRVQLPVIPYGSHALPDDPARRGTVRQRLGFSEDDVVALYVGRLSSTSKCDLLPLMTAFLGVPLLPRGRLRLLIAGDDTRHGMAERLRGVAATLGGGDRVTIHSDPTHEEKLDFYYAGDMFVSPSDHTQEALGLSPIEAMAAGLPVIASDWDGYRDVVTHGETGFLVPTYWTDLGPHFGALHLCGYPGVDGILPGATAVDVDRLTDCMRIVAHDRDRRRAMGRNARRVFRERFDWPVVIRHYEALWSELKSRARRATAAAPVAASPSRRPPDRGEVRRVFGHYPSEQLTDNCVVVWRLPPDDADLMLACANRTPARILASFDRVVRVVRRRLAATSPCSLGELVAEVCSVGVAGELTARLGVARLLKYGVLRRASTP